MMGFKKIILGIFCISALGCSAGTSGGAIDVDADLRNRLEVFDVQTPTAPAAASVAKVTLGRALFFDKELSGNRDVACATCHHPSHATGDGLSVGIGTGGLGLGPTRQEGVGTFIARNSQDLFNRGLPEWRKMFWDERVSGSVVGGFVTPAERRLPRGLESVLAAQAMFPVASRDEMMGHSGDRDVSGRVNEIAQLDDDDFPAIWNALMVRLLRIQKYKDMFAAAYPNVSQGQLGFQHAANAIASFQTAAFTFLNSPFDAYLAGDNNAISESAKQGAILFYGKANCITCHSGGLFTDQNHDNLLIPNLGPGKDEDGLDLGVGLITGSADENFSFRTAPLRNVELTGPWMHNGAYTDLRAAVHHYIDVKDSFEAYDRTQIDPRLQGTVQESRSNLIELSQSVSGDVPTLDITEDDVDAIVEFLKTLTDPAARNLSSVTPASVPSGLPVDR